MSIRKMNRDLITDWFAESSELLAMSIFGAGEHDFAFVDSLESIAAFESATGRDYGNRTLVCLYRGNRLPLRGLVDAVFITNAIALVPDETSCLALHLNSVRPGLHSGNWLDNHAEIRTELDDERGERIAFGPLSDWDPNDGRDPEIRGWLAWDNRIGYRQ